MTKDMVDDFKLSVMSMKEPHEKMCTMKLMQIGYTWGEARLFGREAGMFFLGGGCVFAHSLPLPLSWSCKNKTTYLMN